MGVNERSSRSKRAKRIKKIEQRNMNQGQTLWKRRKQKPIKYLRLY